MNLRKKACPQNLEQAHYFCGTLPYLLPLDFWLAGRLADFLVPLLAALFLEEDEEDAARLAVGCVFFAAGPAFLVVFDLAATPLAAGVLAALAGFLAGLALLDFGFGVAARLLLFGGASTGTSRAGGISAGSSGTELSGA
jgi:hypothetical protein